MNRRHVLAGGAALCTLGSMSTLGAMGGHAMSDHKSSLVVPPEDALHQRTFMQWPVSRRVHPDRVFLDHLQQTIARIANTIAEFEPVTLLTDARHHSATRKHLSGKIELWDIPTEDLWCRDSGPLFARRPGGQLAVSHLQFNGWGNRQVHRHDGQIATRIAEHLGLQVYASRLTGEAGGAEHDGHGLLIAHESSWVNRNRNPGLSRDDIEAALLAAYGAKRMIWSPGVRGQDITDYHIDSLARFTAPGRVLINLPDKPDKSDPFHRAGLVTHKRLMAAGLEVDVIPEPARPRVRSTDFVASYANFYVCNGAVIAPQFGDRNADKTARNALRRHFPGREVVSLNVDALGEVGGGIHCATQQMPVEIS